AMPSAAVCGPAAGGGGRACHGVHAVTLGPRRVLPVPAAPTGQTRRRGHPRADPWAPFPGAARATAEGGAPMQMQTVQVGGIELAVADQGSGPAVVLCHGFPSLARSWRHQVAGLVAAGYRVIAPDMRGYGGSSAPADPAHYDRETTVADMTGLLDVLGIDRAVFVGHDFGASLAWDLPLWAPERVAGVAVLSVPLLPRTPVPPTVAYAHMAREHFLHMHYFQTPGVADAELDADPAGFLTRIYWSLSDADRWLTCFQHPSEGNGYLDVLPDAPDLPWEWMTAEEFDPYIQTFTRTGFTGGL